MYRLSSKLHTDYELGLIFLIVSLAERILASLYTALMSGIFESEERTRYFQNSGLPYFNNWWEIGGKRKEFPYALYTCYKDSPERIQELQRASTLVARTFDKVAPMVKSWTDDDLKLWGFDPKFKDLLDLKWDKFFGLRVGWGWKDGVPKVMEINSQTPTFWFEGEMGNRMLASHFGLEDPNPGSEFSLSLALNQAIERGLEMLPEKKDNPKVGFAVADYYDDTHTRDFLSFHCQYPYERLLVNDVDFRKEDNAPFSRKSHQLLDALVMWYPLEWLVKDKFENGQDVWPVFVDALRNQKFALIHAIPAYFIQAKSMLAFITENADQIFTGDLAEARQYFAKTYLTEDPELGGNFCAKPIWGREGRGSYLMKDGKKINSRWQESYYAKQPKVYQELLDMPKTNIEGVDLNLMYEAWAYRVDDKFVPGAVCVRPSKHLITDGFSYWLPIGL